ncbi:MAG: DUF554 domain-containing protein [Thermaerobacter sp.]|nr:DUF554 domain-containing protein [Thermaerobacter sp.]
MTFFAHELGPFVNGIAALVGALLGLLVRRIPESVRNIVQQALGAAAALIGISMALDHPNFLIVIASLALGAAAGQWLQIEERLERFAQRMRERFGGGGTFVEGFMLATLVWCIGAMAVLGAIQSGLTGRDTILFTKSALDGTSAIFFAAAFGPGVALAAVSVFLYEAVIAALATLVAPLLGAAVIAPLTYVGGVLIALIGLNMLGATKLKVGNLLPAIFFAMVIGGVVASVHVTL